MKVVQIEKILICSNFQISLDNHEMDIQVLPFQFNCTFKTVNYLMKKLPVI